jgi:hypothetical protein
MQHFVVSLFQEKSEDDFHPAIFENNSSSSPRPASSLFRNNTQSESKPIPMRLRSHYLFVLFGQAQLPLEK